MMNGPRPSSRFHHLNLSARLLFLIAFAAAMPLQAGQETGKPPGKAAAEAAEGVSPKEMAILRKHYQWKKDETLPADYSLEALLKVMDDSADNTLELEDYDWQARKLVIALMVVGDQRFAKELDGRAVPVQREAITMLAPLWEKYGLHYPEVQEIAAAMARLEPAS
ncbi:MAG TPA: hypothetical protein VNQ90_19045 [Chthoniobacteraceae bacterium]|nr:hypothetical protein [Chthoniobacteraceae bacterium]